MGTAAGDVTCCVAEGHRRCDPPERNRPRNRPLLERGGPDPPIKSKKSNTSHPKRGTGRREGRESIDSLTPALDDDCSSIAAYLRLCPPTRPTATSKQGGNKTLSLRGQWRRVQQKTAPRQRAVQKAAPGSPSKPRHHKSTGTAKLPARSSPSRLLCSRPSLHKHPSSPLSC